jgi:alkylation response protein AidB-like acyl-CoA dehydrogenase
VRKVTDGIEVRGNIVPEQRDGETTLPINLTAKAAGLGDGQSERRTQLITAFLVQVRWSLREADDVAEQSVQLHGAMGVTEELEIGLYFKRLLAFDTLFGGSAHHYRRHAALGGRSHA